MADISRIVDSLAERAAERELVPAPKQSDSTALMAMIERAVLQPDFDVEKMEKLLEIKERWERQEAKKAFVAALAAFKRNPPTITKNAHVKYATSKGEVDYWHAKLEDACAALGPALSEHGLHYRWQYEQDAKGVTVTCILEHELGHSEQVPMWSPPDTTGSKNSIQAIASAQTYLERYTLLAVTGMAAKGQDDDGRATGEPVGEMGPTLDAQQLSELMHILETAGIDDSSRWLSRLAARFGVEDVSQIPADQFESAKTMLDRAIDALDNHR